MSRRSSKRSRGAGSSSAAQEDIDAHIDLDPRFSSPDQWERFQSEFSKRRVIPSKFLDIPFFASEKFSFVPMLRNLKIDFIAYLNEPYSDDIVRAFYSNLEPRDHPLGIQTEVCGHAILLQEEDLARILKTKAEGIRVTDVRGEIERFNDNFSRLACVQRVIGEQDVHPGWEITADRLDISSRMLMYIAGEIILSKSGNYHTASDAELFMMWAMLERVPINIPFIILKRMIYIARRLTAPLPYGNIIAYILRKLEVDVSAVKGDYILPTKADNATLSRMGYIKQGGEWRKKPETGAQRIRRQARERREAEQPQQVGEGSSPQQEIPQDFQDQVLAMLGNLSTSISSFENRLSGIEGEVGRIRRHWNIPVSDAELDEDLEDIAEEEDQPAND